MHFNATSNWGASPGANGGTHIGTVYAHNNYVHCTLWVANKQTKKRGRRSCCCSPVMAGSWEDLLLTDPGAACIAVHVIPAVFMVVSLYFATVFSISTIWLPDIPVTEIQEKMVMFKKRDWTGWLLFSNYKSAVFDTYMYFFAHILYAGIVQTLNFRFWYQPILIYTSVVPKSLFSQKLVLISALCEIILTIPITTAI